MKITTRHAYSVPCLQNFDIVSHYFVIFLSLLMSCLGSSEISGLLISVFNIEPYVPLSSCPIYAILLRALCTNVDQASVGLKFYS